MVTRISLRAAANRGHADAVAVTEVDFGSKDRLAVLRLRQCHSVALPHLLKGVLLGNQGGSAGLSACGSPAGSSLEYHSGQVRFPGLFPNGYQAPRFHVWQVQIGDAESHRSLLPATDLLCYEGSLRCSRCCLPNYAAESACRSAIKA